MALAFFIIICVMLYILYSAWREDEPVIKCNKEFNNEHKKE